MCNRRLGINKIVLYISRYPDRFLYMDIGLFVFYFVIVYLFIFVIILLMISLSMPNYDYFSITVRAQFNGISCHPSSCIGLSRIVLTGCLHVFVSKNIGYQINIPGFLIKAGTICTS